MLQNTGLPVLSRPRGAGPGAAGVRIASYSSNTASRLALSCAIPAYGTRVFDRRIDTSPLDQLPQHRTQLAGTLLIVAVEVIGHVHLHDRAMHVDGASEAFADLNLACSVAQKFNKLGEGFGGCGLGMLPDGGTDEGEAGRQRRLAHRHRGQRRAGDQHGYRGLPRRSRP